MGASSRKVLFTLPEELLSQIDALADAEHRSRSELIREATRRYIAECAGGRRPIDDPLVRDAVESMDDIARRIRGEWNAEQVVREMRESRYGPSKGKRKKKP